MLNILIPYFYNSMDHLNILCYENIRVRIVSESNLDANLIINVVLEHTRIHWKVETTNDLRKGISYATTLVAYSYSVGMNAFAVFSMPYAIFVQGLELPARVVAKEASRLNEHND